MISPLKKISLKILIQQPVLFDANIFMVGIEDRGSDPNCSFENMKQLYLLPMLESFEQIMIHEMVYCELDEASRALVDEYKGKNVTIVSENDLYGKDPIYTTIFNSIARHDRVSYSRGSTKDRGEVYSLAYGAFHKINYFSSKEIMVDQIAKDLDELKQIEIITFDVIVLLAYIYYMSKGDGRHNKGLKSVYKRYCEDVIKRHKLPSTLKEYFLASVNYI
ncbi:hypothetical protein VV089_19920 [Candidatus Merdisoma sp. JLR.KK011]|uniref:hypothetical protein n=1 Tax=Candidatus Merdisoma sp. JLR.KK011 TaxID=3114299 RepID=UPI002FEF697A